MQYDVVIVGAGVTGGMLARELSRYQLSVCLLEKENDVACGASKANSGIVHGGFDPEPGTLKAKLNAAGVEKLFRAAEQLHVPCRRNGSFVCAFGPEEEPAVRNLYDRGLENGIAGMRLISGDEARILEPALSDAATLVLDVPSAGIICPYELTIAAVGNAMDNGVILKCGFEVASVSRAEEGFVLSAVSGEQVTGSYLINCAGGFADRISKLAGDDSFAIIPRAGEYMLLDKYEGSRVSHTIFQVPTKAGKGILVTPTVDGNLLVGPTAAKVDHPEARDTTPAGLDTVMKFAKKSVPSVDYRQVITSFTGVRASEAGGDFIIRESEQVPHLIHVAAIDSPGLTACVAIAEYAASILADAGLELTAKTDWDPNRENPHSFREMNPSQKNEYIQKNPAYGRIVCRCETVSEGEILAAIRNNPPARDIDGVKRRTRAGMGRCQGGFCMMRVMQLLAREQGIPLEQVTKNGGESFPLTGKL